jgi:diguanylate cyclase (GGDEF)-like protein/PAS domain S-box-containing protein/excisionase family DNA binding protein
MFPALSGISGFSAVRQPTDRHRLQLNMTDHEYTIQETAALLGVPIPKLRRWDKEGVLVALRTAGQHRRYPKDLIDQIASTGGGDSKMSHELAAVKRTLAEKRRIIQLLVESEGRYRDLVETSHDLIWATDAQGSFIYLNNAAQDIFGVAPKDLLGRCFFDFEVNSAHIGNRRFLSLLKRHGEVKHHVTHLRSKTGEDRWIGINARITVNEAGEMRGIRGTARDITEEQRARMHIEHLAMHDALTDLPNRHAMQRSMERAMDSGLPGALMFLDIDHFKYVNDNFGHRTGDQIVIGIGSVLREVVRSANGELFRIGGDEYAIHLPDTMRKDAVDTAERALQAIRHYRLQVAEGRIFSNISASIGIGVYPFHGDTVPALLSNVDISMYQAKDLGRNRCVLFDPESGALRNTHKRIHWAKKLRDALDEDRLVLFAQPVVRLSDLRTTHHEILLRIRDENGAYISPVNFMEIAETLGIVRDIDLRVIEKVLAFIIRNGLAGTKVRYFVNISGVSMSSQDWVDRFMRLLADSDVQPNQLVFEITETAALSEIDVALAFIRRLKEIGCRIALDDFGSGFSSFYYLKQFDVDYLKIDGSFIRDLASDHGSRLFVRALNDVAQGLKKQVIAEWVEDAGALELLRDMGTQYGQGYLFQKPRMLEEIRPAEASLLTTGVA